MLFDKCYLPLRNIKCKHGEDDSYSCEGDANETMMICKQALINYFKIKHFSVISNSSGKIGFLKLLF